MEFSLLGAVLVAALSVWLVLRLESEHLHNTEGFRRVDVVPLHFDHGAQREQAAKQQGARSRRVEVLVELLVYAGVVAILGLAAMSDLAEHRPDGSRAPSSPPLGAGGGDGDDD